jgi:3-methyladenine DNA glycosylase AlkD
MGDTVPALVNDIRAAFAARANPDVAVHQQAYMKSGLPYYGLKTPETRAALKPLLVKHTLKSFPEWELAIRTLWDTVTHREEWYAAIGIARYGRYREYRTSLDALPLYEHMIRTGAWWDVCDEIARQLVGEVLMTHRADASTVMRAWSTDGHMWIRRCSILSQGKHKDKTDAALLRDCMLPSIDDTDFFSRKAIGWALRDYAQVNPEWVKAFVGEFEDRLSGLSKREALRLISTEAH